MIAKLDRLKVLAEKNKYLKEGRDTLQSILTDIDNVDAEQTLANFIGAADKMTRSAEAWMEKV